VLVITDHLVWGDKGDNLQLLQDKLNTYVAFIENGEIYTEVPRALGKHPIIRVHGLYELPEQGGFFIDRATEVLEGVGSNACLGLDAGASILKKGSLCPPPPTPFVWHFSRRMPA
jgi:hypothetical protein